MKIRKILLLGGSGMVGKNILDHPKSSIYDFYDPTSTQCNLLSQNHVQAHVRFFKPDLVIHCAGLVGGIQANIENSYQFLYKNTEMGLNVVNVCKNQDIKNLLNFGSSCMYPKNAPNPLKEEEIFTGKFEPTNEGYAFAKTFVAKLCSTANPNYKTIIPCNLYGKYEKFNLKSSHMIAAAIKKTHEAKKLKLESKTIDVWGDGTARREFMYAGDLADFVFSAIERFDDLPLMMNVGLGYDLSITDYYNTVKEVLDCQTDLQYDLTKPSGIKNKLVDITKQTEFGWSPKTLLKDGIGETYKYFLDTMEQ